MTKTIFSLGLICFFYVQSIAQNIKINEICSSNYVCFEDDDDDFGDWIELYNAGSSSVNVGGMYITDDFGNLIKCRIPTTSPSETTIGSHDHLIIWFDEDPWKGVTHVDAKLNSGGEELALVESNGTTIIDSVTFDKLLYDVTYGRTTDGSSSWSYFPVPTPEDDNTGGGYIGIAGKANFNLDGGFYPSTIQVELTHPDPAVTIYYSLNGNEPSPSRGILYTGPIQVDTNAVIRARVYKSGYVPGEVNTRSYFVNRIIDLPVLSIVTDSLNLWDEDIGIYCFGEDDYDHSYPYTGANFWADWKRPAHIELYEYTGAEVISQNINLSISGNTSRGYAQKSLNMEAKDALGKGNIPYQIFPQLPIAEYKAFKVRNGGSDWSSTGIRDAYNHTLIEGVTDVDYQANRPAIVYLNGQYWGIMSMSEKIDEDYLNEHFPTIDKDSVDLLYNNATVIKGDADNYNDMLDFISNNSLSSQSNYNYIKTQIDISNYINYMESRIYYAATDWPNNNIKFWRPKDLSMKWRWVMWDTDRSTMLHESRPCDMDHNTLAWATTSSQIDDWAQFLLNNLLLSSEFKNRFITQFAHHMNFTFCPARTDSILDSFRNQMSYETPAHIARWEHTNDTIDYYSVGFFHSLAEWNTEVDTISMFFNGRADYVREDIMDMFNIDDTYELELVKVPPAGGIVMVDTFRVPANACDLEYFENYPVTLSAIPNPGYRFGGWTNTSGDTLPFTWNPQDDTTVTAYFVPTLAPQPTMPASNLTYSISNCTDLDLVWTNGSGARRIVVVHAGSPVSDFPVDENEYLASGVFGNGDDLGNGNFVVYKGTGSFCSITGLTEGVHYFFAIIEYNGTATACNYNTTNLLTADILISSFTLSVTSSADSICEGSSAVLTATGGSSWQWSPPTGLSSTTGSVVTATLTAGETYTVVATDANGCTSTTVVTVTVNPQPVVTLGSFAPLCKGSPAIPLSGGSPVGGTYSGDDVSAGMFNPVTPGVHDIQYYYIDVNGCYDSAVSSIEVWSLPVVTQNPFVPACANAPAVVLSGGSPSGGIYSGNYVSAGLFDPALAGTGMHDITYTYSDGNGCTDSVIRGFQVLALPNVVFIPVNDLCIDHAAVILTGGSPFGGIYSGTGVSGLFFDPSVAGLGSHVLTYDYTDVNGCSGSETSSVNVNPLPVVMLGADTTICMYNNLLIDAGAGYTTYLWSTGETTQSILADTAGTGIGTATYLVTVSNVFACEATDEMLVTFDICQGLQAHAMNGINIYPNPSSGKFTMSNGQFAKAEMEIFNSLGEKVFVAELKSGNSEFNIEELVAGLYFVKVTASSGTRIQKLVLE